MKQPLSICVAIALLAFGALVFADVHSVMRFPDSSAIRAGEEPFVITDLKKSITFSSPMPGTNYSISLSTQDNLLPVLTHSNRTVTGFVILVSLGINGKVLWSVTQHQ